VNASYDSAHSAPSKVFDTEMGREMHEVQISSCAEGPEFASSSGVQQQVPTGVGHASERPSGFLDVAPSYNSSVGSCRSLRSLACYRRQAAANIVSSIPSPTETGSSP